MSNLDSRLSRRTATATELDNLTPFDDSTNALEKFCSLKEYGLAMTAIDRGFINNLQPTYGQMKEREETEYKAKKQCWELIRSTGGEGVWSLLCYRHTLHSFDNPPFWNLFNGLLFTNSIGTKFLIIDYHESDKEMRAIPIKERNERSQKKANELFGMMLLCSNQIEYVAATWIGPTTPLEPRFLPSLPIKSIIPSTEIAVKIPSTVSIITNENYVPSFTADDISDIKTSLVVNLGVDEASEYGQAEREELVMKKGCENCGKLAASLRCSACRGPLYCSKECQKVSWKRHKSICKRNQELFIDADDKSEEIRARKHVHQAGCSHSHKH